MKLARTVNLQFQSAMSQYRFKGVLIQESHNLSNKA